MVDLAKALQQFSGWKQYGFSFPFPDVINDPALNKVDAPALIEKLKEEFKQSPNNFMGTDDDLNLIRFMAKPETMAMLKATGKKHILYELPYYQQDNIDNYHDGKISQKDFVREFTRLDRVHNSNWTEAHTKSTEMLAQETANLIISAKESGVEVGFIDPVLSSPDKTNPHAGCEVQDGPWREDYEKMRVELYKDFNESTGRQGDIVPFEEMPKLMKYLEEHAEKYPDMPSLIEKNRQWMNVRVSQNNKFMAQLAHQRTHGKEDFVAIVGGWHTESKDSIPAYLETVSQSSRITGVKLNLDKAESHYEGAANKEERVFTGNDFTHAPNNVLVLIGSSGKPEFYTPPTELIKQAQQITREGRYDKDAPEPLKLNPLPAPTSQRQQSKDAGHSADFDTFSQTLVCTPPQPSSVRAK